jgi:Domain of unknown function (DUF4189)
VIICNRMLASALAPVAILAAVAQPALAADGFGALAYSQSRVMYTLALNHPSRAAAEHAALMECQRSAGDCTSPVWVQHGCVSLALGTGRGFGTGWGSTRESAEREAMGVCVSKTSACNIKRTACTAGMQ